MIVLLGCVKSKLAQPATAAELYTSPLWRARRRYAEVSGADWYILSAKHGLVKPGQTLAPYEMALATRSATDRREWGEWVIADLAAEAGNLRGMKVELHAGALYRDAVRGPLEKRGAVPVNPLAGVGGIGEQLSWYGAQGRNEGTDLVAILSQLGSRSAALPASEWPGELAGLDGCGLYSWWVDSSGAEAVAHGIGAEVAAGLVYAGQTGATKWPSGRPSRATLASRIGADHIRGRVRGSTFRLTLAAALLRELDLQIVGSKKLAPESEHRLTDWIQNHLAVSVLPYTDPDELGRVEDELLDALDPPLNLTGRPRTPLRANLTALRAVIAAGSG